MHHVVGGLTCRAVVVDDDRRPTHEIADPRGDVGIQIQQVATRHHAHEIPTLVHYRKSLMLRAGSPRRDPVPYFLDVLVGRQRDDFVRRDLAHQHLLQKVGRVFRANTRAASRELSVMIEMPHAEQRDEIRCAASREQRQKSQRLPRRLEREDDGREHGVRRARMEES